jgi:hypothetical protein
VLLAEVEVEVEAEATFAGGNRLGGTITSGGSGQCVQGPRSGTLKVIPIFRVVLVRWLALSSAFTDEP